MWLIAADRVALHLFDDGRVAGATDLQGQHGVGAGGTAEREAELAAFDGDADGLHAAAVQNTGDVTLGPEATSGRRARTGAGRSGECGLRHDKASVTWGDTESAI